MPLNVARKSRPAIAAATRHDKGLLIVSIVGLVVMILA
jgi:hypothetical protein